MKLKISNKEYRVFIMKDDIYNWEYPIILSTFPFVIKKKRWNFGIVKSIKYHYLTTIKIPFIKYWIGINTDVYAKCN